MSAFLGSIAVVIFLIVFWIVEKTSSLIQTKEENRKELRKCYEFSRNKCYDPPKTVVFHGNNNRPFVRRCYSKYRYKVELEEIPCNGEL